MFMPKLRPKQGETQSQWIKRFARDPAARREHTTRAALTAVGYRLWKKWERSGAKSLAAIAALDLTAAMSSEAKDGSQFSMCLYSGGPMRPTGYREDIVLDLTGLELPASLNILSDHGNEVDNVVGRGSPMVIAGQLHVTGTTTTATSAGKRIRQLLAEQQPLEASVGVDDIKVARLQQATTINGRDVPAGHLVCTSARLREGTVTPCGGDASTAVLAASRSTTKRKKKMPKKKTNQPNPVQTLMGSVNWASDTLQARAEATVEVLEDTGADTGTILAALDPLLLQNNEEGKKLDQRNAFQARMDARPDASMFAIQNVDDVDRGNPATLMTDALLCKAGYSDIVQAEHKDETRYLQATADLGNQPFTEIVKHGLSTSGQDTRGSIDAILKAGFAGGIQAAISTVSVGAILSDVQNKIAVAQFRRQPATWRSFAWIIPAGDFRPQHILQAEDDAMYKEVAPGGSVKYATVNERVNALSVKQFARNLGLTRPQIINDDASMLNLAAMVARAASRSVNQLVYQIFMDNSTFFSVANNNLIGAALSVDGLSTAIAALRLQKDSQGEDVDLVPAVLLVGPSLEGTARQVLNSIEVSRVSTADNAAIGNPWANINLTLEVESRLENTKYAGNSATAWYLSVGPIEQSPLVVGFLDGVQAPVVESWGPEHGPDKLDFISRGRMDYGVALGDHLGGVKSIGDDSSPTAMAKAKAKGQIASRKR